MDANEDVPRLRGISSSPIRACRLLVGVEGNEMVGIRQLTDSLGRSVCQVTDISANRLSSQTKDDMRLTLLRMTCTQPVRGRLSGGGLKGDKSSMVNNGGRGCLVGLQRLLARYGRFKRM